MRNACLPPCTKEDPLCLQQVEGDSARALQEMLGLIRMTGEHKGIDARHTVDLMQRVKFWRDMLMQDTLLFHRHARHNKTDFSSMPNVGWHFRRNEVNLVLQQPGQGHASRGN